jgi:hypothetical protein
VIGGGILKFENGNDDAEMVVSCGLNRDLGKRTDESQNAETTVNVIHSSMRRDMNAICSTVVV